MQKRLQFFTQLLKRSPLKIKTGASIATCALVLYGTSFLLVGDASFAYRKPIEFKTQQSINVEKENTFTSVAKVFSRAQVADHNSKEKGIWVTYLDGVYDVSDFVDIHPGGERILLAAGQAIDPFWNIFSIHQSPETKELLEGYRIGTLLPLDQDKTASLVPKSTGLEKLFANEPKRHESLIVHSARPCNAEAAPESLEPFITPNELFYVRNHLPVPVIDAEEFRLHLEGPGIPEGFSLSIAELKRNFKEESVAITMQCAGNRRNEMHRIKPTKGLLWGGGAISNAVWTGVKLSEVLKSAGFSDTGDVRHVHINGAEGYGSSIPIDKAMDPRGDVLLAYDMNGVPIPRDHGYPLRAVVPGFVAARSVKWVNNIVLDSEESPAHWQQRDYKGFSPSADLAASDYSKAHAIEELPVQCAFTFKNERLGDKEVSGKVPVVKEEDGFVTVKGYAVAGGGRAINRVDVSSDNGATWVDATLSEPVQQRGRVWAWTKWEVKLPVAKEQDQMTLVCKAVDQAYNSQPDSFEGIYNVRGVLVNAWQRVSAKIEHKNSSTSGGANIEHITKK